MGLDTVELIMRCEEVFAIDIADEDAGQVQTVGDLYRLICRNLTLAPCERPTAGTGFRRLSQPVLNPSLKPWTPEDVWATLVATIVDQLQVPPEDVLYHAHIHNNLRCD